MALGGSFGVAGSGPQFLNTGATDAQGRKSGDLGFARFFGQVSTQPTQQNRPKLHDWWEQNGAQAKTSIAGLEPNLDQPKVDLFKQYGGYGGLIGLQGPLAPGTYKLNDILGIPPKPEVPVVPQYSKEDATQNISRQLAAIANSGQSQSPLSPANTTRSAKGGPAK